MCWINVICACLYVPRDVWCMMLLVMTDPLVLYRLGVLSAVSLDWIAARNSFIQLCTVCPCAMSWQWLARCILDACDSVDELESEVQNEVETCLVQANVLDRSHPAVWARLALVSLRQR